MKKSLSTWQVAGFGFTGALGTLLHFLYDWTGQSSLVAPFSAVNESTWEHMKLLFFPMLIFALIESRFVGKNYPGFWCAKLVGTGLGLTLIPVLYYTYTGALGVNADWFNIAIFFIAAAAAYRAETRILKKGDITCQFPGAALGLLFLIGVAFAVLTFFPLNLPLFQDVSAGSDIAAYVIRQTVFRS